MKKTIESTSRARQRTETAGLNMDQLARLSAAIRKDVEDNLYDGGAVVVARRGVIGLEEAVGFAHRGTGRPCRLDDIFNILSVTKAFTDVIILSLIERGDLALTTRVSDIIRSSSARTRRPSLSSIC